jgi:DNA polymerase-3 subunit delta'
MASIFPWQNLAYNQLQQSYEQQRLPHGVLLTAQSGSGVELFARNWGQFLLCQNKTSSEHCGRCKSCLLFEAGTHPDFHWIERHEDKKQISIDQIRALTSQLHETSSLSGWRIAVIYQTEKLNANGYNALLKTLEEPGSNTQLLLLAEQRSAIPATIISRCQQYNLQATDNQQVFNWLEQQSTDHNDESISFALQVSHGAPLDALQWLQNNEQDSFSQFLELLSDVYYGRQTLLSLSDCKLVEPYQLLKWWEFTVSMMIKSRHIRFTSENKSLQRAAELAENADERLLFRLRDNILFQLKELREGIALNMPMQLDDLATQWSKIRQA